MNFLSSKSTVLASSAKQLSIEAMSLFTSVIEKLQTSNVEASKIIDRNDAKIAELENERDEMSDLIVQNTVVVENIKKLGIK